ncbi:MAG TPA: 2-oxoacid:acceptor oxidoreductase family protein [Desulfosporosinus sp.]|nr:2-oxoacid:acceptor oxidoreductase family protein [Desulfosporosinus sp.]
MCQDQTSGLKAIICIHDTTLGPALGGTRMWNYDCEEDAIPATELANEKLKNSRVANMIILGAFVELTGAVTLESVVGALKKVLPDYRHNLIPLNRQALEIGIELAKGI